MLLPFTVATCSNFFFFAILIDHSHLKKNSSLNKKQINHKNNILHF